MRGEGVTSEILSTIKLFKKCFYITSFKIFILDLVIKFN